jgi:hypothetical protein
MAFRPAGSDEDVPDLHRERDIDDSEVVHMADFACPEAELNAS